MDCSFHCEWKPSPLISTSKVRLTIFRCSGHMILIVVIDGKKYMVRIPQKRTRANTKS